MRGSGASAPGGGCAQEGVALRATDSPPNPPRGSAARSAEKEWPSGPRTKGAQPRAGWLYYQYSFFTFWPKEGSTWIAEASQPSRWLAILSIQFFYIFDYIRSFFFCPACPLCYTSCIRGTYSIIVPCPNSPRSAGSRVFLCLNGGICRPHPNGDGKALR